MESTTDALFNEGTETMHARLPYDLRRGPASRAAAWIPLIAAAALVAACGDDPAGPAPDPDIRPPGEFVLLKPAPGSPPVVTMDTSFVAVKGQRSEVRIRYAPVPPDDSGEEFLELRFEDESLLSYPVDHPRAGALFADGDTVVIRIQVDQATLSATFEPSGLQFNPAVPAELEMRYLNADPDLDGDGDDDPELESEIDLWRQEKVGDPWERVGTVTDLTTEGVEADLTEFSRYGLGI